MSQCVCWRIKFRLLVCIRDFIISSYMWVALTAILMSNDDDEKRPKRKMKIYNKAKGHICVIYF